MYYHWTIDHSRGMYFFQPYPSRTTTCCFLWGGCTNLVGEILTQTGVTGGGLYQGEFQEKNPRTPKHVWTPFPYYSHKNPLKYENGMVSLWVEGSPTIGSLELFVLRFPSVFFAKKTSQFDLRIFVQWIWNHQLVQYLYHTTHVMS